MLSEGEHAKGHGAHAHHMRTTRPMQEAGDEPKFLVFQSLCTQIFGPTPRIALALESDKPLYHEAAVYWQSSDELFVTSNRFTPSPDKDPTIVVSKLKRSLESGKWSQVRLEVSGVPMANGAVNHPTKAAVVFCAQGDMRKAGGLVVMACEAPHETTQLLQSYHGRWFNSLNDVVFHSDGSIWFTDPVYGYEQGFRPKPQLPSQVYRFDPDSGDLRAVADGFGRPNGICFSPDEQTLYITDTDWIHGDGTVDDARPSHIYCFDVIQRHGSPFLANRRLFAMADNGMPDGIKCDTRGNVYSGCGDGLNIWSPGGVLLGKIMIPGGVANFCFGGSGELLLLNETRFWVAKIDPAIEGALLAGLRK